MTKGSARERPLDRRPSFASVMGNREFRGLFVAHLLSLVGDRVAAVAVSILVFDRSHSALLAAASFATSLLPWLLGAPLLSAFADRFPRRRVMIVCDLARAFLVTLMATAGDDLPVLFGLLVVTAFLAPPFEAARAGTIPEILSGDDYVVGSSLTMIVNQSAQVLGLLVGGLLVSAVRATGGLLVDAGSFALSGLLVVVYLRARPAAAAAGTASPGLLADVVDGARLVFGTPELRWLLCLAWLVASVLVVPEGLAVAQARDLHGGPILVALLMSAIPAGMAVGAFVLGRFVPPGRRSRLIRPLSILAMAPLIGTAASLPAALVLVLWVLAGLGGALQLPANAQFMVAVPSTHRSRAFGLAQSGLMAFQGIALLAAGAAANATSVHTVVAAMGGVGLLAAVFLALNRVHVSQPVPIGADHG